MCASYVQGALHVLILFIQFNKYVLHAVLNDRHSTVNEISDSQTGVILPPRRHLAMSGNIFCYHRSLRIWELLLASSE